MEQNNNIQPEQNVETNTDTEVATKETEAKVEQDNNPAVIFTEDNVLKRVQSETDKVRTEYSKKVKKLEDRIAELEPATMTPAELEMKRRLDELELKQAEVEKKEGLLNLQSQLTDLNLPKSLVTFLNGNCNVGELATLIDSIVVERNKGAGYQPTNVIKLRNRGYT